MARFQGMRTFLHRRDLKTLLGGAALVASAGLLMGAAMQPDLNAGALIGPQILLPDGATHDVPVASDPGVAVYGTRVPDYVIGVDWVHPVQPVTDESAQVEEVANAEDAVNAEGAVMIYESPSEPQDLKATPATWRDDPPPPSRYPSADGGGIYDTPARDDTRLPEIADAG